MVNRSQGVVLAFFACVGLALVAVLVAAPDVYGSVVGTGSRRSIGREIAFLVSLLAFISLLVLGVIQRWRWVFWLLLLAFLAGGLRIPASIAQLIGVIPTADPAWYTALQGCIGLVQLAIGIALVRGYRRAGVWGSF